nr:MAG TPA: Protein of unknown function (DUF739) [Caudoviricetes sp.]
MNYNLLKSKIYARGMKVEEFIEKMNENVHGNFSKTVYHKRMTGSVSFRREEIIACKKVLDLTQDDLMEIFFNE